MIDIIDIVLDRLDPVTASTEDAVPQTGLLAIVVALLPALAVVQVMVFNDELGIEVPEKPAQRGRRRSVSTEPAVAGQLGENNVLVADPPLVETHRHAHELHRDVGHQRDPGDVEELLLQIGVQGQERVRVLGQVVSAVVLP